MVPADAPGAPSEAAPPNTSREREQRPMEWQDSTNGLQSAHNTGGSNYNTSNTALAEPLADVESAELNELDDGVEALIIHMDRTTAEHLFLRALRRF